MSTSKRSQRSLGLTSPSGRLGGAFSSISSGTLNVINAPCSAILGGQGNNVTHPYAAVFGNGVNSVAANTFHVENVNVNSMANCTGAVGPITLPVGTMYYCNMGGGRCQVFIS